MLDADGLAEGVRLGSNGLLIWSVRISTWECDRDPNRALKMQADFAQRNLEYHSHIKSKFRKVGDVKGRGPLCASVDFSPEAVDIILGLQKAGARFLPDNGNCCDVVAVLQQFVHALQHVV